MFRTRGIESYRIVISERWATIKVTSTNAPAYCCEEFPPAPGGGWQTPCIEKVGLQVHWVAHRKGERYRERKP